MHCRMFSSFSGLKLTSCQYPDDKKCLQTLPDFLGSGAREAKLPLVERHWFKVHRCMYMFIVV